MQRLILEGILFLNGETHTSNGGGPYTSDVCPNVDVRVWVVAIPGNVVQIGQ